MRRTLFSVETAFSLLAASCACGVAWLLGRHGEVRGVILLLAPRFIVEMTLLAFVSARFACWLLPYDRGGAGIWGSAWLIWPIFSGLGSLGLVLDAMCSSGSLRNALYIILSALSAPLLLVITSLVAPPPSLVSGLIF